MCNERPRHSAAVLDKIGNLLNRKKRRTGQLDRALQRSAKQDTDVKLGK
jgi:hypothetical protein